MGLIDGLISGIGGGVINKNLAVNRKRTQQGYRTDLQIADGDDAFDTAAEVYALVGSAGVLTNIWELTVPAQQQLRWGYGSPAFAANQGYMWFWLLDTGTVFDVGTLRLAQCNARRTRTDVVGEMADSALHLTDPTSAITATPYDKNTMVALPEKIEFDKVGEDSKLLLQYTMISAGTEDAAAFKIPVTVYQ